MGAKHALAIRLVYDKDVADLHDAGLDRLDVVAHARNEHNDRYVSRFDYLDLVLADADRFDDHLVKTGGIEDRDGVDGRTRQAAEIAAGRHRADKNVLVEADGAHSDPVAEDRTARKRA